jgi:hypothetical protein
MHGLYSYLSEDRKKGSHILEDRMRQEEETMSLPVAMVFCVEHPLTSTSRMDRAARSAMRSLVLHGLPCVLLEKCANISHHISLVDQIAYPVFFREILEIF